MPSARFLAIVLLVAACGGSTTTTAPSVAGPTSGATQVPSEAPSLAALASPAVTEPPVTSPPVTEAPVTAPPITEPPVTAPPTAPPVPAIGVKLLIGDEQYMTVQDAEQWAGTSTVKPRSGKVFFTVLIRIDAIKLTSFDSADFKLKDAAGKSYAWRPGRAPHLYSANNMTGGGTYAGWITYEIPKASLGKLTLIYKPHFLVGATFTIPLF